MIKELIDSATILESLNATTKEDVLPELIAAAYGSVAESDSKQKAILKSLLAREALGSTGIGNGVAVPHVKNVFEKSCMVLARAPEGIAYRAVDGRDVTTFFMILGAKDDPETHLKILRWVSGLARNADFRRFVLLAKGADEIRDLLIEMTEV